LCTPGSLALLGTAIACFSASVGYAIGARTAAGPPRVQPVAVPTTAAAPAPVAGGATLGDEAQIAAYRAILERDSRNAAAAVQLGNLLYDRQRFEEAIPYYQQALALAPGNVNVSTDLGTAMYYAGRPDAAVAQYAVSLKADPTHENTLFNLGTVLLDGKNDPAGAIEAWERLLRSAPAGTQAAKARQRIDEARQRLTGFAVPQPVRATR
jgi:cytochrome c-type biogenesis protein CcmH/NrfG